MIDEPVLIDSGPLIALYNTRDPYHRACTNQVKELPVGKVYTCWPVVTEAAYLLRNYPDDRARLLDALEANEFVLLPLERDDLPAIQVVFEKYQDQDVELADASLVVIAARESINTVFTLDRRHFGVCRNKSGKAFHLLP